MSSSAYRNLLDFRLWLKHAVQYVVVDSVGGHEVVDADPVDVVQATIGAPHGLVDIHGPVGKLHEGDVGGCGQVDSHPHRVGVANDEAAEGVRLEGVLGLLASRLAALPVDDGRVEAG